MTTLAAPRRPDVYTVALLDAAIAAPTRQILAKADVQTGAMIALVPTPQDATRLAVEGGEATSELHLTLWYLGEAAAYDEETRTGLVNAITSMVERRSLPPIKARVFGANLWNPDSDSPAWVYAVGDLPEGERPDGQETLGAFRSAMSDAWHSSGLVIDLPTQHSPWAPHVCAEYSNNPDRLAEMTDRLGPVTFDRVRVAFAGEHTDIPLTAAAPMTLPGEPAMGPANATATVTDAVEGKYNPAQPRRDDGTWGEGPRSLGDKLGLADRISLGDGEHLIGSREGTTNGASSTVPVLAAIETPTGTELRIGIVVDEHTRRWSAANKGGTAKFDPATASNMTSILESEMASARRHQAGLHKRWDDVDDARADLEDLRESGASDADIASAEQRVEQLTAFAQAEDLDTKLGEGVIPGSGWADIAYQVWGTDNPDAQYTFHLAAKPHDAPGWSWDDAADEGMDARLDPLDVRLLIRHIQVLAGIGDAKPANTIADTGPLPIRAITEGDHRMGGRTAARAERTRMRVDSKRKWFQILNTSSGTDVYLYGEIGCWGVSASDFAAELRTVNAQTINLHINSPGGEVFDGVAIYNALKSHPAYVKTTVDGIAASAASFIAMAGDEIKVMRHAQMMIHEASSGAYGNSTDLQKQADLLDRLSATIADIYAQRAGGSPDAWRELMRVETWFNAEEAKKAGLADEIGGDVPDEPARPTKATWDLSVFNFAGRDNAPPPALQPVALADDAGDVNGEQDPTDAEPTAVVDAGTEVAVKPEGTAVEDAAPVVEVAAEAPAEPAAQTTPEPAGQPLAWAAPAWTTTPADPWHSLVAGLINPTPTVKDGNPTAQEAKQ